MLTYMFLHDTSSLSHLFFNMFAVFMFGRSIEMTWGSKRYLMYYLITGIGAGLVQELIWFINLSDLIGSGYESVSYNGATIPVASFINEFVTIGASGAVFGILLAFGALYPNAELFIMFIPIPVKAKYFVVVYGLIELFLGIRNSGGDNVAHFAHLGGMLFGLIMVLYWKQKDKKNVNHFF